MSGSGQAVVDSLWQATLVVVLLAVALRRMEAAGRGCGTGWAAARSSSKSRPPYWRLR